MIRIIKGTYGYKDANGTIHPKTVGDAPFSLTKEQEKRLVEVKKVAEYVTDSTEEEIAPVQPKNNKGNKQSKKESKVEETSESVEAATLPDDDEEPPVLSAADPE